MGVDKLVKLVGFFGTAIMTVAIPMLTVYSIDHSWNGFVSTVLCIGTLLEVICIACVLIDYTEERSYK